MARKILPDRRAFYRIRDQVELQVRSLSHAQQPLSDVFDDGPDTELFEELQRLESEWRRQHVALLEENRAVANALKLVHQRIDVLARIMSFQQKPLQPERCVEVTLSEGGMTFPADLLPEQTTSARPWLALRIRLLPGGPVVNAHARWLCHTDPELHGKDAHVLFEDLSDSDRQHLARHVLRWQARQRQKPRMR